MRTYYPNILLKDRFGFIKCTLVLSFQKLPGGGYGAGPRNPTWVAALNVLRKQKVKDHC